MQRRIGILGVLVLPLLSGGKPKPQSENEASSSSSADKLDLVFTYGSEKQKWIGEVTEAFKPGRSSHQQRQTLMWAIPMGSGGASAPAA
jgi:hypothetical protein